MHNNLLQEGQVECGGGCVEGRVGFERPSSIDSLGATALLRPLLLSPDGHRTPPPPKIARWEASDPANAQRGNHQPQPAARRQSLVPN